MRIAALFLIALPWAAQAQTAATSCSTSALSGTRAITLTGRSVSSSGTLGQFLQAVGTATFDGVSTVTFNLAVDSGTSFGGAQTWTGTYAIPSSCVGSATMTSGSTAVFTLIPYNTNDSFSLTGQDANYTYTGTGTAQPAACATSSFTGAYTFSGTGYGLLLGSISSAAGSGGANGLNTMAGLLQFDGAGGISGSWSVATNGGAGSSTVSGTYSVSAPGCVATANVTDQNNAGYILSLSISSANAANFDVVGETKSAPLGSLTLAFTGSGHATFTYPGLAVENAAGISGGAPPGSLFSIYGYGMSTGKAQAESTTWPTTLASSQVTVNGELAPLYYADNTALGSEGLINAQMPLDVPPGVATVVVKNGTAVSNAVAITVPSTANPGVFIYGTNHASAQNFPSYDLNSATTPAKAGTVIVVYFTGGGAVQGASSLTTGHPTPSKTFPLVTANYSVTIAGISASVDYIGLTPTLIGVYQADIVVPAIASGDHNLVITIDGVASNTTVVSTN